MLQKSSLHKVASRTAAASQMPCQIYRSTHYTALLYPAESMCNVKALQSVTNDSFLKDVPTPILMSELHLLSQGVSTSVLLNEQQQ